MRKILDEEVHITYRNGKMLCPYPEWALDENAPNFEIAIAFCKYRNDDYCDVVAYKYHLVEKCAYAN